MQVVNASTTSKRSRSSLFDGVLPFSDFANGNFASTLALYWLAKMHIHVPSVALHG